MCRIGSSWYQRGRRTRALKAHSLRSLFSLHHETGISSLKGIRRRKKTRDDSCYNALLAYHSRLSLVGCRAPTFADVAELADAQDLGSCGETRGSSTLPVRNILTEARPAVSTIGKVSSRMANGKRLLPRAAGTAGIPSVPPPYNVPDDDRMTTCQRRCRGGRGNTCRPPLNVALSSVSAGGPSLSPCYT